MLERKVYSTSVENKPTIIEKVSGGFLRLQYYVYSAAAQDGVKFWKERIVAEVITAATLKVIKIARISSARLRRE